jgi:ABC-type Fe3+-hydroxamate transport system substrate-binding protein
LAVADLGAQTPEIRFVDDAGREVVLASWPERIVSLVPVATEILFELGASDRVVGRTRYDEHPPEVLSVPSVGDAIRPSTEAVLLRDPDLVILVGGSDNADAVREMDRLGVPFVVVLFNTLTDLRRNVLRLGQIVGRDSASAGLWKRIDGELQGVARAVEGRPRPAVYYDVGYPPAFTVGSGSYLNELIEIAGGRNVFADLTSPSPRVSLEAILSRDPDVIVQPSSDTSGSGMPSPAARPGWQYLRAVDEESIVSVPAGLVHRLGPRIGEAARALALALHPEAEGTL